MVQCAHAGGGSCAVRIDRINAGGRPRSELRSGLSASHEQDPARLMHMEYYDYYVQRQLALNTTPNTETTLIIVPSKHFADVAM